MKRMAVLAIVLAVVLLAGAGLVTAEKSEKSNLNRAIIKIDTLSCGGCFSTINAGMVTLEGYNGMGANLFRKLIAVDFSAPLTPEKITDKLSEVGYPGTLESVEQVSEKESFAYQQSRRKSYGGGGCCSAGPAVSQKSAPIPQGGSCCALPPKNNANPAKLPTEDL